MSTERDMIFMNAALSLARAAYDLDEAPVGCVIVHGGAVIAEGYNFRETGQNALLHAEVTAIEKACEHLGSWRLDECELYVTLEPCPMCAGAIINSRIARVVYGAADPKAGCFGSVLDFNDHRFNHKPEIIAGVLGDECSRLLSDFFKNIRERKNRLT